MVFTIQDAIGVAFRSIRTGLLASLLGLAALNSSNSFAADPFFDESFGNYHEDLQTAKDNGKKGIFIFFHMEECPFCHRMRTTILQDKTVIDRFRSHFLTYMHDIEGSNEVIGFDGQAMTSKDMAEKVFRVRATPVMIIFDLDGNPIVRYTGPTRTQEEFLWIADYVLDGAYKNQSFTAYKRTRKRAENP
ncbi:thioredoxin [Thiosulfatimonas sediminis]|uniref:Thioredoxin n=1 Tax=Thiosulfatimonas sediminis TaxID=2675054 RepID=A0A6F8PVU1_9GAMM|nr:thioredoxin fold domain-containing protein [Thiosulfatimonas sediminis]BBP46216.1 thioredoxin [Thiosulfatimonas sediminis]